MLPVFPSFFGLRLAAVLALVWSAGRYSFGQAYVFQTLAGQPPQTGGADGSSTDARFWFPSATAVDANGNVYVGDTYNHTIRRISPTGVTVTLAGGAGAAGSTDGPALIARFNRPAGVVVDRTGTVYIADNANHTVRQLMNGTVTTLAGLPGQSGSANGTGAAARFNGPWGLALASDGTLYVSEPPNNTVRKITPGGGVTAFVGIAGTNTWNDGMGTNAHLSAPFGLGFDPTGSLYFIEATSRTIRKATPAGLVTTVAGDAFRPQGISDGTGKQVSFFYPQGLTTDSIGNVYIVDNLACMIRRMTPAGAVSTLAGTGAQGALDGPATTAQFARPLGISADAAGNLYIADAYNHSIRKITSATGIVSTLAGPRSGVGSNDGSGGTARFYSPTGVTGDSRGNLFVCESGNNTIRRISAAGEVTTFAGLAGLGSSSVDGTGAAARFDFPVAIMADPADNLYVVELGGALRRITPTGVVTTVTPSISSSTPFRARSLAVDRTGNCFVTAESECVIRKITPAGVNTIVAGRSNVRGVTDGPAAQALFAEPFSIAIDSSGNLYVGDSYAVRKISSTGIVSTLAGSVLTMGTDDGVGAAARFQRLFALAVDGEGNIFAGDENATIRKITSAGVVTTIGGAPFPAVYRNAFGVGTAATFLTPTGIWVDVAGTLFITDSNANAVIRAMRQDMPAISTPPQAATLLLGTTATFSVAATGGGLSYQWKHDGVAISGATNASFVIASVMPADVGRYAVDVSNAIGTATSTAATLEVTLPSRLVNLSVLATLDSADDRLTVGMTVGGAGTSGAKPLLVRGVGPSLRSVGVTTPVVGCQLQMFSGSMPIAENAGWAGDQRVASIASSVGAFPLVSPTSQDAALFLDDGTGANRSVRIFGSGPGYVLAELYDATPAGAYRFTTPRLVNVSVLKAVGGGLTAGFVIDGTTPVNVLVRAIGPSLASFGVTGVLPDPKLELFDGGSAPRAINTAWGGAAALADAFRAVGAFPIAATSRDAALLLTLPPGSYTARVTSLSAVNGDVLIEVYEVR